MISLFWGSARTEQSIIENDDDRRPWMKNVPSWWASPMAKEEHDPDEVREFFEQLRHDVRRHNPRRVELNAADSELLRSYMDAENRRSWERYQRCELLEMNSEAPFCDLRLRSEDVTIYGVPVKLDRAETRFIKWDDHECLLLLAAQGWCPAPSKPESRS